MTVLLETTPLVEPERQRLARLALEAVEALGGSPFAAVAPLEEALRRLREDDARGEGAPRVRLELDGGEIALHAGGVRVPLATVPGAPEAGEVERLRRRLRQESEQCDAELLRRRNEAIQADLEAARARAEAELAALHADLERKKAELKESIRRAETDALTGLYNRAAYDLRLERAVRRAARQGEPLTLMLLDLDRFKEINDTHGHQYGDEYLRRMADAMRAAVRADVDHVCRMGGDEFAIILFAPPAVGERVARDVLRAMDGRVSIGIAPLLPGDTPERLVARADAALYEAKRRGRGRAVTAPDGGREVPEAAAPAEAEMGEESGADG